MADEDTVNTSIATLTGDIKRSFCRLYARYVKPSWINLMAQRHFGTITDAQLDPRLVTVYASYKGGEYGFHWVRFGSVRMLLEPALCDRVLDSGTGIICSDTRARHDAPVAEISHSDITEIAVLQSQKLLEYVVSQVLKTAPGEELFGICETFSINLDYIYNKNCLEPKTITLVPLKSPGSQHERKVHKYVLANASERFRTTIYGSGQIKPKNKINVDCTAKILDWFIDGLYNGVLNLSKIRKAQRKQAFRMLNESMVSTVVDFGKHLARALNIKDATANSQTEQNYFDSNDSDSD
ncbi:hypothetical protein F-S17_0048 [Faustovirus]|nr:hypothetical protein F-S17_0048 [Faustovirus]